MCVVEPTAADGTPSGRMLTACTSPAEEGLHINTQTEKLVNYRRQVLELLFAGRNHFCMFCSQSGDCDLQARAIEHGMDNVRYPFLYSEFENDTTDARIQADHNRCILCQRCVRTCSEKVGACTLGLKKRGWATTVDADFGSTIDPTLRMQTVDFMTNLDTTGGNSGSPVLDADGKLIGLNFDSNWEAVSASWMFDPRYKRAIHVDMRYLRWLLAKVYPAPQLLEEMRLPAE